MLDLKIYFNVGTKIQMDYFDAMGHSHEYISQVIEFIDDEFIDVLIPMHNKRDVYLRQDTILKIILVKGEAIYEFKAALYEKILGRIPLLRLKILSEVNKIQRRDFYRLKLMRDIEARLVEDFEQKKYGELFKCILHDISAGGVLLSSSKELQEKDLMEFTLDLNENKLTVYGAVVRRTLTGNHRSPYSYGVRFEKMSEPERTLVTKFIFEEQRRLIKKGLV
jgi:c-di-GMP-binding flagellar brake protein YcgR